MKLVILDPDLTTFSGHNFNYVEGIAREARARGIDTRIFAFRDIQPAVAKAVDAVGHFTTPGRAVLNDIPGDANVGVSWTHVVMNAVFLRDLVPLTGELGRDTLVFVPAATSRQLFALAQWLALIAPPSLPSLVCLFRYDLDNYPNERELLKVPIKVLATLQRPAVLCCETAEIAETYVSSLDVPVTTIPFPFVVPFEPRASDRVPGSATVGYFGDARYMKGSHLLPGLCEQAAASGDAYHLCIQTFLTGEEAAVPAQLAAVRRAALAAPEKVRLIEGPQPLARYHRLLLGCDIVLLPHNATTYRRQTSAIFCEAVSAGKVIVMPEETSMSSAIRRMGGDPVTFSEWTVQGVQAALLRAVRELDARRPEAMRLAGIWNKENGAKALVERLVGWHHDV